MFRVLLLAATTCRAGRMRRLRPPTQSDAREHGRPAPSLKLLRTPDFQRGRGRAATFRGKR
jgi:hypothetical protein